MGYYEQFKKIRNQIRKLDTISLVLTATAKLRDIETKPIEEWEGFLPWRLLLIIKWGFEYGEINHHLRYVDERMLIKLMNLLHEFEGAEKHPFLEEKDLVLYQ